MKTLLRELLYIFDRKKKIQALQLFFLTLVGAALEAIGIGVILPFVGLVIRPELIQEKESLQWLYHLTGADSHRIFLIYVTIGLFLVYLFKNSYLVFLYNLQYSFTFKSQETVSSRLFQIYLYNPYAFHMSRNSADLVKNLTGEMNALFNGVVRSGLTICTELIIFIVIIVLLFTVQPWSTLVAIIILGGAGLVFSAMVRKKLEKSGQIRQKDYGNMIKWVNQGIGSIKEIKVLNVESFFTVFLIIVAKPIVMPPK